MPSPFPGTDLLQYGATDYRQRSEETSTLLLQLFERYRLEGTLMPDMLEQLAQDTIEELLRKMPLEERLKGLSPEERLKGLSLDDLLAALPPETRAALVQRLRDNGSLPGPGGT